MRVSQITALSECRSEEIKLLHKAEIKCNIPVNSRWTTYSKATCCLVRNKVRESLNKIQELKN